MKFHNRTKWKLWRICLITFPNFKQSLNYIFCNISSLPLWIFFRVLFSRKRKRRMARHLMIRTTHRTERERVEERKTGKTFLIKSLKFANVGSTPETTQAYSNDSTRLMAKWKYYDLKKIWKKVDKRILISRMELFHYFHFFVVVRSFVRWWCSTPWMSLSESPHFADSSSSSGRTEPLVQFCEGGE